MAPKMKNSKNFNLKPMKCELNYLSKSDGSAILAQGDTVVLASVNGPLDTKQQNQSIEKCNLEILFNSKAGKPCIADRYKENIIRQTCESALLSSMYPRSAITVTLQELEDYGGLVACCVNATCLACICAGVALRCVFAAVSCVVDATSELRLNPTPLELEEARAQMTFVFDSRDDALINGTTEGEFSEEIYKEALEKCRAASHVVFDFYREIVGKYCNVIG